jgi:hypothetical protein
MPAMAADAFIQCRVTSETKALIQVLADRERITESALVRQLLEVVLRTSAVGATSLLAEKPTPNRDVRLYVRLDRKRHTGDSLAGWAFRG